MKTQIITITILFLFVSKGLSQNDSIISSTAYNDPYKAYFKTITFKIGGGLLLPQGQLKDYFGASPLVELSLDFPVTERKSLELALQFVVPNQNNAFEYARLTDTVQTKATFMFNPMLRFKTNLSRSTSNKLLLGIGLGASVLSTDARNTDFFDTSEDRSKYEIITAFLVSPSLDYVKTFKNNNEFTFSLALNYSPYKIEGALQEDIGSVALLPRILYSF